MQEIFGSPRDLWYDNTNKVGELTIIEKGTAEIKTIRIEAWRKAHYLFVYVDKSLTEKYTEKHINGFFAKSKEEQIKWSTELFVTHPKEFRYRVEEGNVLWTFTTMKWQPLTINEIKPLLPEVAVPQSEELPASDKHGGIITYNILFADGTSALVKIDGGVLDGAHSMRIKGMLTSDVGEVEVDRKLAYRHTDAARVGEGLIDMLDIMHKLHDALPNLVNIPFDMGMLNGEKLTKDLQSKLTGVKTVYHALAVLRDAGKKTLAGKVLINAVKPVSAPKPTTPAPVQPEAETEGPPTTEPEVEPVSTEEPVTAEPVTAEQVKVEPVPVTAEPEEAWVKVRGKWQLVKPSTQPPTQIPEATTVTTEWKKVGAKWTHV